MIGHPGELAFQRDGVGRPGGLLEEAAGQRLAVLALDGARSIGPVAAEEERAEVFAIARLAAAAVAADAAIGKAHDDAVARLDQGDASADRLDDAGTLVSEDVRGRIGLDAVDAAAVRAADAATRHLNKNLVVSGAFELHGFDRIL